MASKKLYGAYFGSYVYDDTELLNDSDGDFSGFTWEASISDGFHICAGIKYLDTDQSNYLSLIWNEDDSSNRTLNLKVGAGNRTFTLYEDLTIADGYNLSLQALGQANAIVFNEGFTIGDGYAGTLTYSGDGKTLTVEDDSIINQDVTTDASPTWAGFTIDAQVITDIFDEDAMGSDSDTALATQQSIKAYVDAQITAHDHDGDTLKIDGIDSDGGAFAFNTTGTVTFNQPVAIANATWDLDASGTLNLIDTTGFVITTSDSSNIFRGILSYPEFNATEMGLFVGVAAVPKLTSGTVSNIYGFWGAADLDGGTVTQNAVGCVYFVDQEAGNTISGDGIALYLYSDFDGTVTGTTYLLYMLEGSNIDYGIYQNGSAPNEFGGNINLTTVGTTEYLIGGNRALAMPVDNTNIAIGNTAGNVLTTGATSNTFIGYQAGLATTTGVYNTAIGYNTLTVNTTGGYNVAIGYHSMQGGGGGLNPLYNAAVGVRALQGITSGQNNVAIGHEAGLLITTGNQNIAIGAETLETVTTNSSNVAIGYRAARYTTAGSNVALGTNALLYNSTGEFNCVFGVQAMQGASGASTGSSNTAFGYRALYSSEDGTQNTAIGGGAMLSLTSGQYNVAIGLNALDGAIDTNQNVAIGYASISGVLTGHSNTAVGSQSLRLATSATYCVAVGREALEADLTGSYNTSVGYRSMMTEQSGAYNAAVGAQALYLQNGGTSNTAVGYRASYYNVTGDYNTAVGREALSGASGNSHSNNVGIGYRSLYAVTTGGNNVCIGFQAGDVLTTGASNIIIGYDIDPSAAGTSNELNIGDTIFGDLADGNIGVGGYTFDATAENVIQITGSVEPGGSVADSVQLYEKDSSQGAGHGTLGIYTEEAVEVIGTFTASHKLRIWHNGTEYWVQLDAV